MGGNAGEFLPKLAISLQPAAKLCTPNLFSAAINSISRRRRHIKYDWLGLGLVWPAAAASWRGLRWLGCSPQPTGVRGITPGKLLKFYTWHGACDGPYVDRRNALLLQAKKTRQFDLSMPQRPIRSHVWRKSSWKDWKRRTFLEA